MDNGQGGELKPGDTIRPGELPAPVAPVQSPSLPEVPVATAAPEVQPPVEPSPAPASPEPRQPAPFAPSTSQPENDRFAAPVQEPQVQWTASEFVAHDKSPVWYLSLVGASLALSVIVFLLTKDKISAAVILVAGIALGFYAGRKPRHVSYALFDDGLAIGQKSYDYNQFRSFSLGHDGPLSTISLLPHRRFEQLKSLYFDPQYEPLIVDFIASKLPLERRSDDLIDQLMKKIRF